MRKIIQTLLVALLYLMNGILYAGNERNTDVLPLSQCTVGTKLIAQDEHFGIIASKLIKNCRIETRLSYTENELIHYSSPWSVIVNYELKGYPKGSNTLQVHTDALTITYDPDKGTTYIDDDLNQYPNLVHAKLEVISIIPSGSIGSPYPDDIFLSLTYESEVYYMLSTNLPLVSASISQTNELTFKWNTIYGAESYDLEYVIIELGNEITYPVPAIAYDFRDAVRVNVHKEHYTLPMNYPRCAIVYRVRAIGVYKELNLPYKRKEGNWSYNPTTLTLTQANTDGKAIFWGLSLHPELNWQSSTMFAEDGKRKDVLNFFDGSQRGRQTLTFNNTDNTAIIAETIYDYDGRPAVSSMPAAVQWTGTHFYINNNGTHPFNMGYNRSDFATDVNLNNINGTGPDNMHEDAEANKYYSDDFYLNNPYTRFTPHAGNIPFTQTVYKSDGTGRIVSQSGVGDTYRYKYGRTTDYYYASPMQVEIDRLFGNEVGLRSKYKKNFVVDPNRQATIQYLDQQGRVIATALSGEAPDSLVNIDGKPAPVELTENLLLNNNHQNLDKEIISTSVIPVTSVTPVDYVFVYSLSDTTHCPDCWEGEQTCIDCYYDVYISVKDEYGNIVKQAPPYQSVDAEFTFTAILSKKNPTLTFTVPLTTGTYTVTKILKLNKQKVEDYKQDLYTYLTENNSQTQDCFPVPDIEPEPCDCKSLCDKHFIGDDGNGNTLYFNEDGNIVQTNGTIPASVQNMLNACKEKCDELDEFSDCKVRLKKMKTQVSPGGQYFDNKAPHSGIAANSNWFDHYVAGNPPFPNYSGCIPSSPGGFWSGLVSFIGNTPSCSTSVDFSVQSNQTWQKLRDNWRECFADYLVQWHPEYCAYKYFCHTCSICTDGGDPEVFAVDVDVQNCSTEDFLTLMYKCNDDCWAQGGGQNCCNGTTHNYNFFNPIGLSQDLTDNGLLANNTTYVSNMGGLSNFDTDPLVDVCSSPYDESWIAQKVEDKLRNFLKFEENGSAYTHSIWYVLDNPQHGNPNGSDIEKWYHSIHNAFNGNALTPYMFFRGVYHFYRSYYMYQFFKNNYTGCANLTYGGNGIYCFWNADTDSDEYIDNPDPYGTSYPSFENFHLVFPKNKGFEDYENYSGTLLQQYQDEMCDTNCEAYADSWMQQYAPCLTSLLPAVKADMREDLIEICKLGCDVSNNFLGHSNGNGIDFINTQSIPSVQASTFDDVAQAYAAGCSTITVVHPPVPPFDQGQCNCELLIDYIDPLITGDNYNPTAGELSTITSSLNTTYSLSLDTATVRSWINFCRDGSGEMTLTYIQELECVECKCENLSDYIFNYSGDTWANLSTNEKNDFISDFNFNLGTSYTTTNVDTWLTECAEQDPDETQFVNFPEELRCIADVKVNLEELENTKCEDENAEEAQSQIQHIIDTYVVELLKDFFDDHYTACYKNINYRESFTVTYDLNEYYYTLYYYDQAGNLVKTVPPEGVKPLTPANIPSVQDHRRDPGNNSYIHTEHTMATIYHYDSRNLLRKQVTPDADTTLFWYDPQGRLVASQNQKQFMQQGHIYSYTLYDNLDRIIETGEVEHGTALTDEIVLKYDQTYDDFEDWLADTGPGDRTQVTQTFYDAPIKTQNPHMQKNLRNRVAAVAFFDAYTSNNEHYQHATYYSYDEHGNVQNLIHDNRNLASITPQERLKKTNYAYDVVSGNVNYVYYQKNKNDQHIHKYEYDADNRITNVYTSNDSMLWDMDARYHYYAHGPLARVETGQRNVQGSDYNYTLQGWLKSMNTPTLYRHRDPGKDGYAGTPEVLNRQFAEDAFGFALGYHYFDYKPVDATLYSTQTNYFLPKVSGTYDANTKGLFNGNISRMELGLRDENIESKENLATMGKLFTYDQLNRLKTQITFQQWDNTAPGTDIVAQNNTFAYATNNGSFATAYTYDFNGNIRTLSRTGHYNYGSSTLENMDNLVYSYENDNTIPGFSTTNRNRNRLLHVQDLITSNNYTTDIKINTTFNNGSPYSNNYNYDAIGNLVKDEAECIDEIVWTLSGKISEIKYDQQQCSTKHNLQFRYDAMGNRVLKIEKKGPTQPEWIYTYYTRDAQGNVMAVYNISFTSQGGNIYECTTKLEERHIYGSSRLGLNKKPNENKHKFSASIGQNGMFDFITNQPAEYPNGPGQAKMIGGSGTIALYHDTAQSYTLELYTEHPIKISSTAMAGFSITEGNGTWITTDTFLTDAAQKITIEALDTLYLFSTFEEMFGYMEYSSAKTTKLKGGSISMGGPLLPIFVKNYSKTAGEKAYELVSHLGNVHMVISDRKVSVEDGSSGNVAYFVSDVISTNDVYPFGSPMPGRSFGKSRYGFNGKEMDDEVYSSTGTSYDYGFRIYNPRLGRFLSVDPLTDKFPMLTPYQFASNTPIWAIDLDGLEARVYTDLSPILNGEYPHSFLSVIDDEGVINVYTYGQYGQKGIAPLGEGALVHLKGADANSYIKNEFKEYPMRVFEISDKAVDKQKIIDYYSNEMKSYNIPAERKEPHAPNYVNEENGSSAVKYKPYYIFADGKLTENCTSCMQDGLKEGGFNMDFSAPVPYSIDNILKMMSIIAPGTVKDVTGNEKNAANNNFNAPVTLPTVTVTPE